MENQPEARLVVKRNTSVLMTEEEAIANLQKVVGAELENYTPEAAMAAGIALTGLVARVFEGQPRTAIESAVAKGPEWDHIDTAGLGTVLAEIAGAANQSLYK